MTGSEATKRSHRQIAEVRFDPTIPSPRIRHRNKNDTSTGRERHQHQYQLGRGALSLIAANTLLLVLFFVYDVTIFQLVLVYWCECAWIGVFSGIKLITASMIGDPYENRRAEVSGGAGVFMSLFVIIFSSTAFFSLLGMILMGILMANDSLALSNPGDDMINHIGLVFGASLAVDGSPCDFLRRQLPVVGRVQDRQGRNAGRTAVQTMHRLVSNNYCKHRFRRDRARVCQYNRLRGYGYRVEECFGYSTSAKGAAGVCCGIW